MNQADYDAIAGIIKASTRTIKINEDDVFIDYKLVDGRVLISEMAAYMAANAFCSNCEDGQVHEFDSSGNKHSRPCTLCRGKGPFHLVKFIAACETP